MMKIITPILTIATILVQPSYAQVTRHRRLTPGRLIVGCIIGGLAALFFLILCLLMMRRQRSRGFMAVTTGAGVPVQSGPKPMFGGPWGRSDNGYNGQSGIPMGPYPNQGSNYNNPQPIPPVHQSQTPYNPYLGQNGAAPPPTYGKDADYGRQYSPPAGPPPNHNDNQGPYTPPPGPPPAHTTGQDNQFVGGFRS